MEVAGAQRVLLSQAQWFHKRGYAVLAAFIYDKQDLAKQWQVVNSFPVISLEGWDRDSNIVSNSIRLIKAIFKLFRLLKQGPAVIISFTQDSNLIGLPVAWLAGVPVRIGSVHGRIPGSSQLQNWLHGRLVNSRIPAITVCVSADVKDQVVKRDGARSDRLVVIENGVALGAYKSGDVERAKIRTELGVSDEGILLISVGRLTTEKGHSYLVKAISKLSKRYPNIHLVIVGDGPLLVDLHNQANELNISDNLTFTGLRNDVIRLLISSDIYVQPSLSEGLSLALLEALGANLPVVATTIPGFLSVIKDGHSGLLVPPADAQGLADALQRLINDADLRHRIADSGHMLVEKRYSVEAMCQSYQRLIFSISTKR